MELHGLWEKARKHEPLNRLNRSRKHVAARRRIRSHRPAIAANIAFDVGGSVSGVIYAIACRVATGYLPPVRVA